MKIELERSVNLLKDDVKSFTLPELLDIINPLIQRLTELTMDNKRQGRILDWQIDGQKQEIKKLIEDIGLLKLEKDDLKKQIESEKERITAKVKEIEEKANLRLAEATKRLKEAELMKEDLEKKKYFRETVKV